jgi:hypothetical protein
MPVKNFYVLNTAAAAPGWFGALQADGTAPTDAACTFGYAPGKLAVSSYCQSRLGASGTSATTGTTSYINSKTGPTAGTGATNTTSGDSFITPTPYTGSFAAGTWTFVWNVRAGTAGLTGKVQMRVWASANASGTSARELTSGAVNGTTQTIGTSANVNVGGNWAAPAITLNNEYLFFQLEFQEAISAGSSNSDNALFRVGSSIATTNFSPANAFIANDVTVVSPTIGTSSINQTQNLKPAVAISVASPVLGQSSLTIVVALPNAVALSAGSPVVGAPVPTLINNIVALNLEPIPRPSIGVGDFNQICKLTAVNLAVTSPALDAAVFSAVSPHDDIPAAVSLTVGSPTFGGVGPWQPTELGSALLGWNDASDSATVTITGSGVSAWGNKGVSAFTLTQSADAAKPNYASNTVTFTTPQVLAATGSPTTYDFLVVGWPNTNSDWRTLLHNSDGHNLILLETGTYNFGGYNEIPPYFRQAGALTWPVVDGLAYGRIGTGEVFLSRDGGALFTTTIVQPVDKTSINYVGGYYSVANGGNQGWGGIKELFLVPYNSSDDVRQKLEGYAAHKWGLASLLPVDHPYKSAPPVGTAAAAATLQQVHVLQAAPLIVQSPVLGVATVVVPAIPLAANSLAVTAPAFGTPALKPVVLLAASNLATAPPVAAAATFSQAHALIATALASSSPAFTVPAFNRTLAVTASPLTVSSPTVGAGAFAQPHTLSAIALATTSPVLGVVTISQAGSMAALPLVVTPPTLGVGTLTQKQVLTASTTTTSSPSIASATLQQQQWFSATSVVTAAPSVGVCVWSQNHVLNATPLTVLAPAIPTATLGQSGVMACIPIAVGSPAIGAPAFGQKHVAAAQSLATGPPALGSTSLSKVLSATALAVGPPVFSPPLLTKVLTAAPLSVGAPVLGTPACALRVFDLAAPDLAIGPPTLPALTISQSGVMAALPLSVGAPVLGAPALGQRHVLSAAGVTVGAPVISQGNFGQKITLDAAALAVGAPVLGPAVLGQEHRLSASTASAGRPVMDAGNLGQAGVMAALPLRAGSPIIPVLTLVQHQRFTGNGVTAGRPSLDAAKLGISIRLPRPQSVFAGRFKPLPAVLGQAHRLIAQGVSAGAPKVGPATMFEGETFPAVSLVVSSPVLGAPTLTPIACFTAVGLTLRPELGRPTLGQVHKVASRNLSVGSPWIGYPRLGKPPIVIVATDLETGAPVFGALRFEVLDHLLAVVNITSRQRLTPITGERGTATLTGRRGGNIITAGRSNGTIIGQRQRTVI